MTNNHESLPVEIHGFRSPKACVTFSPRFIGGRKILQKMKKLRALHQVDPVTTGLK